MDDPEKLAQSAVDYALADANAETLRSYVERGRHLRDVATDELVASYRTAYIDWSKAMLDEELGRRASDIQAELELRGLQPPSDGLDDALMTVVNDLLGTLKNTDASAFASWISAYREAVSKKQ